MPDKSSTPRIVISTSVTSTMAAFGKGTMAFFRQHGFDVDYLSYDNGRLVAIDDEGFVFFSVNYIRALNPLADIKAFFQILKIFRERRPDVISLATLKPCFLGGLAGRITGVPVIIRHKWGSMLDCNYKGFKRFLLFKADKIANKLADRVAANSHELLESEINIGSIDPDKATTYGHGSAFGIDTDLFKLNDVNKEKAKDLRQYWGITDDNFVFGTVMRINTEKGICELINSFTKVNKKFPNTKLLIIGRYDIRNLPPDEIVRTIEEHPSIKFIGFQEDITVAYAAMDVFVLPTYREGFCNANLEASSMEKCVISTDVIGVNGSSVINNETGLIVPARDAEALKEAMERVVFNRELCERLGQNGRQRVERNFTNKYVWHCQLKDICSLLLEKDIQPPVLPDQIEGSSCPLCEK